MDKTSYRVLTLTVSCMLFLSIIAERAAAWPCPPCPDCYNCTETGCVNRCNPDTQFCCGNSCCSKSKCCHNGQCVNECPGNCCECVGNHCLNVSGNCDQVNCDHCVNCSCQYKCDHNKCESCYWGDGFCYVCGGYPGMVCCNGQCCDTIGLCHDCINGQCEYVCDPDKCELCDGNGNCPSTCDPDTQCCDNGTCVEKCDPDGGSTCTYPDPPGQLCAWVAPGDPTCLEPGAWCGWEAVAEAGKNAACAPCDPGCTLDSTYCVLLKPIKCNDVLSPIPPFHECACKGTPPLYEPVESGTRYICP